jgi:hypothetical protein
MKNNHFPVKVKLTPEQATHIEKYGTIPWEVLEARIDMCAKKEGLVGYAKALLEHKDDITKLFEKVGYKPLSKDIPLDVQLYGYLEDKYRDYIWEGCRKNHIHGNDRVGNLDEYAANEIVSEFANFLKIKKKDGSPL